MTELVIVTILAVCTFVCTYSLSVDTNLMSFDRLYTLGIAAYEEERWFQCASFMSRAIGQQKNYAEAVYKCRLQCKSGREERLQDFKENSNAQLLNLLIFQDLILNVECVRRCKKRNIGEGPRAVGIFNSICQAFSELKPYDYLQICAFQTDNLKQAVAAAYTYFLGNTGHKDMLNNLQYYRNLPNVDTVDFVNLEEHSFQRHYIDGTAAYGDDDWPVVAEEMETALEEYFPAEEKCRLECEGLLETAQSEDRTDVLSAISDLYTSLLRCQLGCADKLGVIHGKPVPDYVADHYHYLQYAYFKLKNYDKAAGAAESYLLFRPNDDIMLNNKLYYLKRGYGESFFIARKEAMVYWQKRSLVREILRFVDTSPWYEDDDDGTYNVFIKKNYVTMGDDRANPGELQSQGGPSPATHFIQHFERLGIKVFADSDVLHGPERFAADGLMRPEQCQELIYLTQAKYDGDETPPMMQDVNIPQAVELVKNEAASDLSLRIFLRASEVSRFFLQQYLNLTKVYLQSTRIVCRDHKDLLAEQKDCYIQEDGTCLRWFPIDEKADYVGAIHLNKVMTGGEIYVANENLDGQGMMISPRCGRMVGFPAKVPHGILPFPSGVRCSLVFGYTKNRTNDEKAHMLAFRYLDRLEDRKQEEHLDRLRNRKSVLQGIKDDGITVTMTEEDLSGEERVLADDLMSEEDCELLQGLAKNGALRGDGYGDKRYNTLSSISPHTKHEMFQGLTVLRAAQLANLGEVDQSAVEMYLNMSEKSRDFVEKYFNLESPLYFDFTHLVCRRAIENEEVRDDLSHPVHADNCILQDDQTCVRQFPAYTQRDYSALLYLNNDFEGGDFFFAHANKTEQVSVRPRCGRLVGFNAAAYHGVTAVTKGERCALALWFTLDPDFKEIAHLQARKMLQDRRNDPNYNLPSSSPLFTVPGINEKEGDPSAAGKPFRTRINTLKLGDRGNDNERTQPLSGDEASSGKSDTDKSHNENSVVGSKDEPRTAESQTKSHKFVSNDKSPVDESQGESNGESQTESAPESNDEQSKAKISADTSTKISLDATKEGNDDNLDDGQKSESETDSPDWSYRNEL